MNPSMDQNVQVAMNPRSISIEAAHSARDLDAVRTLFREYAAGLDFDLCFQGFTDELATLPGKYAAPAGGLFLARRAEETLGCVAFRPLADGDCEMKRLYVRPAARGEKLGRRLATLACDAAREAGYRRICLDTIDTMREAITLYESLGFRETAPYVFNPIAGARYLAREL
jgi:ribosomal protein S18 acetylase RimI-like enzyme